MSNNTVDPPELSTIVYGAGVYSLIVSALYLLGYWGAFGLNAFEYMGLSDLLLHAIFPFSGFLLVSLLTIVTPHLLLSRTSFFGAGADTPVGQWVNQHLRELGAAIIILASLVLYFGREPLKWVNAGGLLAFFSVAFFDWDYAVAVLPNKHLRIALIFGATSLVTNAFPLGRVRAWDVKQGRGDLFLVSAPELPLDQHHPVSYLGHLGDFFILYQPSSKQLLIVRTDKISSLVLTQDVAEKN